MLRSSIFRSRLLLALTVTAFILLLVPLNTLANPGSSTGAIVGFIYGSDMKTPVEKAVVKIRNIKDGQEFLVRRLTPSEPTRLRDWKKVVMSSEFLRRW